MNQRCETPFHIGDRCKYEEGTAWLKDPEYWWWCPDCTRRYWNWLWEQARLKLDHDLEGNCPDFIYQMMAQEVEL